MGYLHSLAPQLDGVGIQAADFCIAALDIVSMPILGFRPVVHIGFFVR